MNILSIYWSICSGAAVYSNGKIVAALHEERFTRRKNDDAFPENAIREVLKLANLNANDLDLAGVASHSQDHFHQLTRPGLWSIQDYLKEQKVYWKPTLIEGREVEYQQVMAEKIDSDQYPSEYWKDSSKGNETYGHDRRKILANFLGIPIEKVHTAEHHQAHAYYSFFGSDFLGTKTLALTVDANGDGKNATIGIFDEEGNYERKWSTDQCPLARYYRYATLILGMKPNEHEYKLMGLAPYGKEKYGHAALSHYRKTMEVVGLDFRWKEKPKDSYYWFQEKFVGERFDNIAWAIQTFVEESIEEWTLNAVREFGIGRVVFSGGVALNVKAMGRIARRPEVEDLFIMGSAADESLCIGTCLSLARENKQPLTNKSIENLYLGTKPDTHEVDAAIDEMSDPSFVVEANPTSSRIAHLLSKGLILARCVGPMEFGQRALGNRSILADPVKDRTKERINQAIKNRDFWMPFAPVILDTFEERYLKKPTPTPSPHMTLAFETTDEGYEAMPAACHPSDRTARAQILREKDNPQLYRLLEAFAEVTGRGALLNTSFNLHGFPIVRTAKEAIRVLERSSLDGVLFERKLLLRKAQDA